MPSSILTQQSTIDLYAYPEHGELLDELQALRSSIIKQLEDVRRITQESSKQSNQSTSDAKSNSKNPLSWIAHKKNRLSTSNYNFANKNKKGTCGKYAFAHRLKDELEQELNEVQMKICVLGGKMNTVKGMDLIISRAKSKHSQAAFIKEEEAKKVEHDLEERVVLAKTGGIVKQTSTARRKSLTSARELSISLSQVNLMENSENNDNKPQPNEDSPSIVEGEKQDVTPNQPAEPQTNDNHNYAEMEKQIAELTKNKERLEEEIETMITEYETKLYHLQKKNVATLKELYDELIVVEEVNEKLAQELEEERARSKGILEQLQISKQLIQLLEANKESSTHEPTQSP